MNFYEKVIALCQKRGVSRSQMADDIGISRSAPKAWSENSTPHFSTVKRIADYFEVPVSYFSSDPAGVPQGECEAPAAHTLGDIERELLSICERLDMKKKGQLLLTAYALLEEPTGLGH